MVISIAKWPEATEATGLKSGRIWKHQANECHQTYHDWTPSVMNRSNTKRLYMFFFLCAIQYMFILGLQGSVRVRAIRRRQEAKPWLAASGLHGKSRAQKWMTGGSPTGWWFGTWLLLSIIYGIILPIDFHIFQDCYSHQPALWLRKPPYNPAMLSHWRDHFCPRFRIQSDSWWLLNGIQDLALDSAMEKIRYQGILLKYLQINQTKDFEIQ